MECAGDITAVGDNVKGFEVGDAVLTCGPGALRTHLTIESRYLVKKPCQLSYEEAATIPIAFLTAYYSLHQHTVSMRHGFRRRSGYPDSAEHPDYGYRENSGTHERDYRRRPTGKMLA